MSNKIGRNDPCPCGSGKKYKKCCYGKTMPNKNYQFDDIHQILPSYDKIDYGKPALDEHFFGNNTVHEISAPRLVYSCLLAPEVERLASEISNQFLDRGVEESMLIENTEDVKKLIDIMSEEVDPLNYQKLKNKLLKHKESSIPLIINELKRPKSSAFIELSIGIIHASRINCSKEILDITQHNQIGAYAISLLCMLLGFYKDERSEKILWDYYHYFREHFYDETYSDGPLLGLIEIWERKKEKLSKQTYH